MNIYEANHLGTCINSVHFDLVMNGIPVNVGEWQAKRGEGRPQEYTIELTQCWLRAPIPLSADELQEQVEASQSWAEDHFQERVSRIAYNPPPSAEYWHRDKDAVDEHRTIMERGEMKYSHTYPERYWPNNANTIGDERHEGIRFTYGDLDDVVKLLVMSPMTRQAYLPVWFPEDTGAHHGERVPCSLGYHFLLRENKLDCAYFIRSCDAIRHLRNDIYLTCRLVHWVINECAMRERSPDLLWEEVSPGNLYMWIGSMHCFAAERQGLRRKLEYH